MQGAVSTDLRSKARRSTGVRGPGVRITGMNMRNTVQPGLRGFGALIPTPRLGPGVMLPTLCPSRTSQGLIIIIIINSS